MFDQLTAGGSATFALAILDDPEHQFDQRASSIIRDDIVCDAAGKPARSFVADTVVLHRDGRADRVYRIDTPELNGGPGISFRLVYQGTWTRFGEVNWAHYSEGPSIKLVLALEPTTAPNVLGTSNFYFRVHTPTDISTLTSVGIVHCPKNPNPGHSVMHKAFLRYLRL